MDRAAYITKRRLYDSYSGCIYYRQSGNTHVLASGVLLPDAAPRQYEDVQTLLTSLNSAEKRNDAQMGRSYHLSLPEELTQKQQLELVWEFVDKHFTSADQCSIFAIHLSNANMYARASSDSLPPVNEIRANPHAHLIVPFRTLDSNGFQKTKTFSRMTNNPEYLVMLRESWANIQNRAFERLNLDVRVSHESLAMQGVSRKPSCYLGTATIAQEQKGIHTERGEKYRDIMERNARLRAVELDIGRYYTPLR